MKSNLNKMHYISRSTLPLKAKSQRSENRDEPETVFLSFLRSPRIYSFSLCSLACRACATTLFLLGSLPPIDCSKIPALISRRQWNLHLSSEHGASHQSGLAKHSQIYNQWQSAHQFTKTLFSVTCSFTRFPER
jgi:hypothetical protein